MAMAVLDDWAEASSSCGTAIVGPLRPKLSTPTAESDVVIAPTRPFLRAVPAQTTGSIALGAPTGLNRPAIAASREAKDVVVRITGGRTADFKFDVRQRWEGIVSSVDEEEFSVTLRDLTDPTAAECEAVLAIEEVPPEDLPLLQPGAVLYWSIGYEQTTGTHKRVSVIRLRRLPAWSRRDVERARQRAAALGRLLESDDEEHASCRRRA